MKPIYQAVADHALLVTFDEQISAEAHAAVVSLDQALAANMPRGVIETLPALVNLLVSFDPLQTDHAQIEDAVRRCLVDMTIQPLQGQHRHVQVCYDGDCAPDLDTVAVATGLTRDAVINAHLSGDYRVLMYGFSPGYAYLSGVVSDIQVPRKPVPVRDVAAGSVIIAGTQCLVTTLRMPTGWSIIGQSPTQILTGEHDKPFLFDVADRVTFERINYATFAQLTKGRTDG